MNKNTVPDASGVFAKFATQTRFEDFPAKVIANTKRSIFDTVGVMLAGGGPDAQAHRIAQMLAAWGGAPTGTVIGHDMKLPAPHAAFANAAMAHQYDFDDVHDEAVAHPTSSSFSGALAAAQEMPGATGRELLASVLVGNEVVCRVGLAIKGALYDYVWIWPAVVAIWGATTASARVMGLTADQLQSAYGLTLHQTGTTLQCHHGPGSDVRGFRDGFGARNGVTAAYMARAGLRGDPEAFEGKYGFYGAFFKGEYDRERLLAGLGQHYAAERISIKAWASARETHATLQALLELRERHGIDPAAIERVVMRVGETNMRFCEPGAARRRPTVRMDALCALPFCASVALIHGGVPLGAFSENGMRDERVLALAERIAWQADEALSHGTVEGGDVEISLRNGQTFRHQVRHGMGHPDFPVSDELLVRKFIDCAALATCSVSESQVREFWEMVQKLEDISVAEFSAALRAFSRGN